MRTLTLFSCLLILCYACEKEEISNNALIGKWEFKEVACYSIVSSNYDPTWSFDATFNYSKIQDDFGSIQLEIKKEGEFVFSSKIGTQKFRVLSTNTLSASESYVFHNGFQDLIEGTKYCLKSKTGETFYFSLFYKSDTDELVTVPWIDGQSYYSRDKINYAIQDFKADILGHQHGTDGIGTEYLGLFKR